MTAALSDWLYNPRKDALALRVIGAGFAAGIVLACAGFWALGKAGL